MEQLSANELQVAASELQKRVHELRLTEIETREHIQNLIKEIYTRGLWREAGAKSLQAYCMKQLGYRAHEARDLAIQAGAILRAVDLRSNDPVIQQKIDRLRDWRRIRAREEGVAAYRIFSNRTLLEIACTSDLVFEGLLRINGLGFTRIQSYGKELIAILNDIANGSNRNFGPPMREAVSLPLF